MTCSRSLKRSVAELAQFPSPVISPISHSIYSLLKYSQSAPFQGGLIYKEHKQKNFSQFSQVTDALRSVP